MRRIVISVPVALAALLLASACSGGGSTSQATPTTGASGATSPAAGSSPTPSAPATSPTATAVPYQPPHDKPGPASEKIQFKSFFVDQAPLDFQNGAMDFYAYSLKTAAARDLRNKPGVRLEEAPATSVSIVLNPAPASSQNDLNPFSIKEIRQTMQFLVNRSFVASDIYLGMALPMVTQLSPTDYDFLTVYDQAIGLDIRYDPERARSIIQQQMTKAGATMVGGKWQYKGRPLRPLKFIGRVEDERRDVANLVKAELEKAGFEVAVTLKPFADAVLTVYSSDPQSFEWHLYTEGWSRGSPQRYDYATINQMAAPWQGNMPGWKEVGFWQYESADLDSLGQRLFTGAFKDRAERDDIYRRMTQLALDESVRVWVATVQNSFPLSQKMLGVTTDLVSGPKTARTLRDAYIPGKDTLTVGNLWVWTDRTTWNPVGGFGDLYSSDIVSELYDPPVWTHPFTGLPIPYRAQYKVETAGPTGKLTVPAGAVMWDAAADKWNAVPQNTQATSKVVFDYSSYFKSKWHDGQSITMGDVIYPIAQAYELAYDANKSKIEFALGVTTRPYLQTFKGYRIGDNNTLEVYVDFWHFEESQIASYASPSGVMMPWEVLAAMDDLVFTQRRAAYSDTASARFNVPWLSLVMKRDAGLVDRTLNDFISKNQLPASAFTIMDRALVSPQEAIGRYQAARAWFEKYGHLFISNGPFFLTRFDPPAQFAEIQAFRDPTYPFKPGSWYLGIAPQLEIKDVKAPRVSVGKAAEVSVTLTGPGALGVRYVFLDAAASKVIKSGEADRSGSAFVIKLDAQATSGLKPGLYSLNLAGYSDQVAALTERKVDLDIGP